MVVHPQSIVHSMVEFVDGSRRRADGPARHARPRPLRARLARAPARRAGPRSTCATTRASRSSRPTARRSPRSTSATRPRAAAARPGAALNAADEVAVERFLAGEIAVPRDHRARRGGAALPPLRPGPRPRGTSSAWTPGPDARPPSHADAHPGRVHRRNPVGHPGHRLPHLHPRVRPLHRVPPHEDARRDVLHRLRPAALRLGASRRAASAGSRGASASSTPPTTRWTSASP